jgi:type I restriction enzyme S subunit
VTNLSGTNLNNGHAVGLQGEGRDSPSKFPPYPKYEDSGVNWLGPVPSHWTVRRLRYAIDINPSKSEVRSFPPETIVSFIPMEAVGDDGGLDLSQERLLGDVLSGYTYVRDGDVTIAKITPCFENGKATVMRGLENGVGFGTTELTVMRPRLDRTTSDYLFRVVTSEPFRALGESSMYGAGGQKRVPDDFVRDFRIAWPPSDEQKLIARFLNHETAKIDALIAEQQRLIELLKEKRQAVISHAVTKGLDPDVPMKDSGVEWLGEVPAHWDITRLKYATCAIFDCPHETPIYDLEGEYLVVRTADIDEGVLESGRMYRLNEDQYRIRTRRSELERGDIVYGREGERWGHAAVIPVSGRFCLGQRMMQFRVGKDFCSTYLMYQLNSVNVYRQGEVETVGATSPHVNVSTIANFVLAHPPEREQRAISEYVESFVSSVDELIEVARDSSAYLSERRSALISAAVTGKIDVRAWQPDGQAGKPRYTESPEEVAAYE